MSERKLVEAFKTFFEKSVSPHLSGNDEVMREWNHLNKIISADPVDYSQIEFYLLLANKNQPSTGSKTNISSSHRIPQDPNARKRFNDFNAGGEKSGGKKEASGKRKNLVSGLESFQKMLQYNQERLEGMSKKEGGFAPGSAPAPNGVSMRRY